MLLVVVCEYVTIVFIYLYIVIWGLDNDGCFISDSDSAVGSYDWFRSFVTSRHDVQKHIVNDLAEVRSKIVKENQFIFAPGNVTDKTKGRRLMLLLQQDLLPGMSGRILEAKGTRDADLPKPVSLPVKLLGWVLICGINLSLLFYIYLFAMNQTEVTQNAWFQSFLIWFFMDMVLVATLMVYITHFLIPSFIMQDVYKIRNKLLDTIDEYRNSMRSGDDEESSIVACKFNAADYFFASRRIALMYPHLLESKIVLNFTTPWPRQSYNHIKDVSKSYTSSFRVVGRSLGIIVLFIFSGFLNFPTNFQDVAMNAILTGLSGYAVVGIMQLYAISPLVAIAPVLFIAIMVHFLIFSDRTALENTVKLHEKGKKERLSQIQVIPKVSRHVTALLPRPSSRSVSPMPLAIILDEGSDKNGNSDDDEVDDELLNMQFESESGESVVNIAISTSSEGKSKSDSPLFLDMDLSSYSSVESVENFTNSDANSESGREDLDYRSYSEDSDNSVASWENESVSDASSDNFSFDDSFSNTDENGFNDKT